MAENVTIFIPDISGYTEFVSKIEIEHGAFYLNHLLETIVNSIGDDFLVSEIEGDAVLLYRKGTPPTRKEIIDQCIRTFKAFHSELGTLAASTLCQCGACLGARNLTLKFVVHFGAIAEINVARFVKASGVDMVIAHRLLKNSIPEHEYVLATSSYLKNVPDKDEPHELEWSEWKEEYPSIGVVEFNFASLSSVKKSLPPVFYPETSFISADSKQSIEKDILIDASYIYVHDCLLDMEHRRNFLEGYIRGEGDPMLHRGAHHTCIYNERKVFIEPKHLEASPGEIIYEEFASTPESGYFALYRYETKSLNENKTHLRVIVSPQPGHSFDEAQYEAVRKDLDETILRMKEYCENSQ
ncbi:MAG TPA: DUF2652 domain-containing protein [Chitinophagales bacterium]|nr:DUF2652 domain-containing protein [Chitinophagales bacterium]